ncbi:MAG: TerB family tellurite resistance protein [Pseudomonadota bacterium]
MGLFSRTLSDGRRAATAAIDDTAAPTDQIATAKAVLVPSILAMCAGDGIGDAEVQRLIDTMAFSAVFHPVGAELAPKLIDELRDELTRPGSLERFMALMDPLSPALRETSICMAIRMAAAEGHLSGMEHRVLLTLSSRLGIPPEQYRKMIEVVGILQRAA